MNWAFGEMCVFGGREFEKQNHPCLSEREVGVPEQFNTNHFTVAIKGATDELKKGYERLF